MAFSNGGNTCTQCGKPPVNACMYAGKLVCSAHLTQCEVCPSGVRLENDTACGRCAPVVALAMAG